MTNEAGEVTVFEVLGQDSVAELVHVADNEASALGVPRHNVIVAGIADEFKRLREEHGQVRRQSLLRVDHLNVIVEAFTTIVVISRLLIV